MKLPFLRFFKKTEATQQTVAAAPPPVIQVEKPASERFAKTFTPNATRQIAIEAPPAHAPADDDRRGVATMAPPAAAKVLPSFARASSLPASTLVPSAPRSISLGDGPRIVLSNTGAPAAVAERAISLALADITLPEELVNSTSLDPNQRLLFKATELERGMSSGRPAVTLRAIYQQVPEIFKREIAETDTAEVTLPFAKVLEQFASFQVRSDQIIEDLLPEVETPFLQVTIEDSERFGTSSGTKPVSAPAVSPVEIPGPEPATSIHSDAPIRLTVPKEPEPAAASPRAPIRLSPTSQPGSVAHVAPTISPNGTGVPATERVPASSGSPVPTPFPSPFAPPVASPKSDAPSPMPGGAPIKLSPVGNDLREKAAPKMATSPVEPPKVKLASAGTQIRLPLRPILRGVAPCQMSGPIENVAEEATIELPFAIIQPQLSLGKVSISPAQFHAALPEKLREAFTIEDQTTPIALPLQDVLQHLPDESLKLREDQEAVQVGADFETPFSLKAAEDAVRLQNPGPAAATTKEAVPAQPAPAKSPRPKTPETRLATPSTPRATPAAEAPIAPKMTKPAASLPKSERDPLQLVFDTDEPMDARNVVLHASRLPGVRACAIVFSDGLSLAGNIPAEFKIDPLCAIAPALVKKCQEQMSSENLGTFAGLTLSCTKSAVSFFAEGDICLAALHWAGQEIEIATRTQLSCVTEELARTYTQSPVRHA